MIRYLVISIGILMVGFSVWGLTHNTYSRETRMNVVMEDSCTPDRICEVSIGGN